MLRKGMFISDRYEIIDKVGSGGMSDVYKAKCHKLNRYVAIKVLKPEFSEDKNFVSKHSQQQDYHILILSMYLMLVKITESIILLWS